MNESARRAAEMSAAFSARYGDAPQLWTRAPGRVDLMGSHTDYNQGLILSMTIDRDTWMAAHPREDRAVRVLSLDLGEETIFSLDAIAPDPEQRWANYVRGMASVLRDAGYPLRGFDALIHTTVPVSAGLSSSAALEMAVGRMLEAVGGFTVDAVELAVLGQRAENHFVGVACGILDQYTSAVGKAGCALLLDARTITSSDAPIADGIAVVICDTRTKRELAGSEYGVRRAQCEQGAAYFARRHPGVTHLRDVSLERFDAHAAELPDAVARRCRYILEENARVPALATALTAGDHAAIHQLTAASFAGARDLYEITVPEMEIMIETMLAAPGCIGARQAGAGFGGCMAAFVAAEKVESFVGCVAHVYTSVTGIEPRIYPVQPSPGASRFTPPVV
jgi:galactokinase